MTGIHQVTDRAVRETQGQVMLYDGQLVQAYYSSTCGGHTSAIEDVWLREPIPYLEGVRDAPREESSWCRESPHFRWTVAWSAKELGEVVRQYLPAEVDPGLGPREVGTLTGLRVLEYDRSGRVHRLQVQTDRGEWVVWGDRVRWLLRPVRGRFPSLRSALFRLEEYRDDEGDLIGVRLQGGGFGHGIGLCQTGALAMARAGNSARRILGHYYPRNGHRSAAPLTPGLDGSLSLLPGPEDRVPSRGLGPPMTLFRPFWGVFWVAALTPAKSIARFRSADLPG